MNMNYLKKQYPNVDFSTQQGATFQRSESAFYPLGLGSAPEVCSGLFVRMENCKGGSDTVLASNTAAIHALAAWHNNVRSS